MHLPQHTHTTREPTHLVRLRNAVRPSFPRISSLGTSCAACYLRVTVTARPPRRVTRGPKTRGSWVMINCYLCPPPIGAPSPSGPLSLYTQTHSAVLDSSIPGEVRYGDCLLTAVLLSLMPPSQKLCFAAGALHLVPFQHDGSHRLTKPPCAWPGGR